VSRELDALERGKARVDGALDALALRLETLQLRRLLEAARIDRAQLLDAVV
jgi:hypothetical protein